MTRDISSEILAAIAVVAVIAFVIVFGVLLSSTQDEDNSSTSQSASQATPVTSESNIGEQVVPEQTAVVNTVTIEPSSTPDPRPTLTTTKATMQSSVETVTAESPTPSETPTIRQSATSTLTLTSVPTLTPTRTPFPVETSGILPTPTTTATPSNDSPVSSIPVSICSPPTNWYVYVVQPGDTLFSIARAVNSSVAVLRSANCLEDVNRITVGDVLFVPMPLDNLIPIPSLDEINRDVPAHIAGVVGCLNPGVQLIQPAAGSRVSGVVAIHGSATWPDFGYYKLEVRLDSSTVYNFIAQFDTSVSSGQLGTIDTGIFNPGLHWVRLILVDATGNIPEGATCVIPIIFE